MLFVKIRYAKVGYVSLFVNSDRPKQKALILQGDAPECFEVIRKNQNFNQKMVTISEQ